MPSTGRSRRSGESNEAEIAGHLLLGLGNPDVRALIAGGLRDAGYLVTTVSDGESVQEWMQSMGPPDVVVVDLELAGRPGIVLLAEARRAGCLTPFILLSRQGREQLIALARRHPPVAIFETPFDLDDLCCEVGALLGRRRERRAAARVPAAIEVHSCGGLAPTTHHAVEISRCGLLLRTDTLYPVGGLLDLRFDLAGRPTSVRGEVASVRELDRALGVGLRFLDLPDEAGAAIESLALDREVAAQAV